MKIAFVGDCDCALYNMMFFGIAQSMYYDKKVLLLDLTFGETQLEDAFRCGKSSFLKEESYYEIKEGLDYLLYRCNQNLLNAKMIKEGVTFLNGKLAIVKAAMKGNFVQYHENVNKNIFKLLMEFEKIFPVVLVRCDLDFYYRNSECFDTCIKNILHDNLYQKYEFQYRELMEKDFFIIIGQVLGDLEDEKDYIIRNFRVSSENIALIPYDFQVDIKLESGKLLEAFDTESVLKADDGFVNSLCNAIFMFKKWYERVLY